ncbi:MAG: hypothetical protein M1469_01180 [Bacteroidetes bacterium]|nr:hypothetical protein [Bacteroidota bacterium]
MFPRGVWFAAVPADWRFAVGSREPAMLHEELPDSTARLLADLVITTIEEHINGDSREAKLIGDSGDAKLVVMHLSQEGRPSLPPTDAGISGRAGRCLRIDFMRGGRIYCG